MVPNARALLMGAAGVGGDPPVYPGSAVLTMGASASSQRISAAGVASNGDSIFTFYAQNISPTSYNTWLVRMSTTGSVVWAQKYNSYNLNADGTSIYIDADDNIYVLVYQISPSETGIAKFSSSGSLQWAKQLFGASTTYWSDIAGGADGFIYAVGRTYNTSSSQENGCIVRLTSSGAVDSAYRFADSVNPTGLTVQLLGMTSGTASNLYFSSRSFSTSSNLVHRISKFNWSTGSIEWSTRVSNSTSTFNLKGPRVSPGGLIYFAHKDAGDSLGIGLLNDSGTGQWRNITSPAMPNLNTGNLVSSDADGNGYLIAYRVSELYLLKYNSSGTQLYSRKIAQAGASTSTFTEYIDVIRGRLFVGGNYSVSGAQTAYLLQLPLDGSKTGNSPPSYTVDATTTSTSVTGAFNSATAFTTTAITITASNFTSFSPTPDTSFSFTYTPFT